MAYDSGRTFFEGAAEVDSGPSASYRVTLDREGCWRGVRVWDTEDQVGPEPLAACLNVIDYVLP